MVFYAPFVCRYSLSCTRFTLRYRAGAGADEQQASISSRGCSYAISWDSDMVKRIVTGAHYGLLDWLAQRVTAVVMAVYILLLIVALLISTPHDHAAWETIFANQWIRIASFLFFVSLCWHAWIGIRNILMDYIHETGIRLTIQVLVILSLLFYAVWAIEIVWG